MDREPPQSPEGPASDRTAVSHKRARTDSESSVSADSILKRNPFNRKLNVSTRTLQSEDLEFVHENGRIYGNYSYLFPCDEAEQDRLTIQHQIYVLALKGKYTTVPVTPSMSRILDLGAGPGHWALGMAQQYPHLDVVGIDMAVWDLETTEEEAGAGLVTWEIDDLDIWGIEPDMNELATRLEGYNPFRDPSARNRAKPSDRSKRKEPQTQPTTQPQSPSASEVGFNPYLLEPEAQPGWHFSQPYDFIHLRSMKGSFAYWEDVYGEIYRSLSPGGYIEVVDYELVLPDMPDSVGAVGDVPGEHSQKQLPPEEFPFQSIRTLYKSMMEASYKSGRPLGTYYMHPTYLEEAGFKDVRTTYVNVPVGPWPAGEEQKKIGKMLLVVLMESLEPHCLRLLTKHGDAEHIWTADEVRQTCEKAQREVVQWGQSIDMAGEMQEGWCANFKWTVGRKPMHE